MKTLLLITVLAMTVGCQSKTPLAHAFPHERRPSVEMVRAQAIALELC